LIGVDIIAPVVRHYGAPSRFAFLQAIAYHQYKSDRQQRTRGYKRDAQYFRR